MHGCIDRDRRQGSRPHLLGAVGQPQDEMLDGHGAVRAPTNAHGGLKHARIPVRQSMSPLRLRAYLGELDLKLTLGIIATSICGVVGIPCSRNACRRTVLRSEFGQ